MPDVYDERGLAVLSEKGKITLRKIADGNPKSQVLSFLRQLSFSISSG